jgi:hypothetical protein
MMIEGSGSGSRAGSGSIPLTSGYVNPVDPDPDSDPEHWVPRSGINIPDQIFSIA